MTDLRIRASADRSAGGQDALPAFLAGRAHGWTRVAPLAFLVTVAVAVTVRDPHVAGAWGVCPTHGLLGIFCPGCGSLRAFHDLMHGDVAEAVGHNALLIPAIVFVLWESMRKPGPRWSRLWLVAVVVFTVTRNLPGSPLAP